MKETKVTLQKQVSAALGKSTRPIHTVEKVETLDEDQPQLTQGHSPVFRQMI